MLLYEENLDFGNCQDESFGDEIKKFDALADLCWAWNYLKSDGKWAQFDCIDCIILESKWWHWKQDPSISFKIIIGSTIYRIKFENLTA